MIAAQPSFAKPVALSLDQLVDPLGEVSAKALDIIRVVHVLRALLQPGAKLSRVSNQGFAGSVKASRRRNHATAVSWSMTSWESPD